MVGALRIVSLKGEEGNPSWHILKKLLLFVWKDEALRESNAGNL
jgi:hypothetical protein